MKVIFITVFVICLLHNITCRKKKSSNSINFDSLISGMDPAEQEIFRQELQREVKKFHIPGSHKKTKANYSPRKRKLKPRPKTSRPALKMLPGICDPICEHQCVHGCDFRCCVPGYQSTNRVPRPPPSVVLPGSCSTTCSPTCFPECSPTCCAGGPGGMFQSALDLSTLFPPTCAPGCPETCFPFCTPSCCSGQSAPPQASQYAMPPAPPILPPQQVSYTAPAPPPQPQQFPSFTQCGGSCSQECAPSCLTSCCIEKQRQQFTQMYVPQTQPYMQQQQPQVQAMPVARPPLSCTPPCSPACGPTCTPGCCEGKEAQPPRPPPARPAPKLIQPQQMQPIRGNPNTVQPQQLPQQQPQQQPQQHQHQQQQKQQQQQSLPTLPEPADGNVNLPEAQPMFQEQAKLETPNIEGFPEGLFMKEPSQAPPDVSDIKPETSASQIICPLSCPDMCLPDCTTACCNGNKPSAFEIDKKSKIAEQLALLKRKRRHLEKN